MNAFIAKVGTPTQCLSTSLKHYAIAAICAISSMGFLSPTVASANDSSNINPPIIQPTSSESLPISTVLTAPIKSKIDQPAPAKPKSVSTLGADFLGPLWIQSFDNSFQKNNVSYILQEEIALEEHGVLSLQEQKQKVLKALSNVPSTDRKNVQVSFHYQIDGMPQTQTFSDQNGSQIQLKYQNGIDTFQWFTDKVSTSEFTAFHELGHAVIRSGVVPQADPKIWGTELTEQQKKTWALISHAKYPSALTEIIQENYADAYALLHANHYYTPAQFQELAQIILQHRNASQLDQEDGHKTRYTLMLLNQCFKTNDCLNKNFLNNTPIQSSIESGILQIIATQPKLIAQLNQTTNPTKIAPFLMKQITAQWALSLNLSKTDPLYVWAKETYLPFDPIITQDPTFESLTNAVHNTLNQSAKSITMGQLDSFDKIKQSFNKAYQINAQLFNDWISQNLQSFQSVPFTVIAQQAKTIPFNSPQKDQQALIDKINQTTINLIKEQSTDLKINAWRSERTVTYDHNGQEKYKKSENAMPKLKSFSAR